MILLWISSFSGVPPWRLQVSLKSSCRTAATLQAGGSPVRPGPGRGSERFLWWTWEEWWVMGKHTWGVSAGEPGVRAAVPWRPRCDGQSSDVGWAGLVPGALGSWLLLLLPAPRCQQRQRWCLCTTLVPTQFNANHDKAKAISRR